MLSLILWSSEKTLIMWCC